MNASHHGRRALRASIATTFLIAAASFTVFLTPSFAAPADAKGGHDHPLIQRCAGCWLIGYKQSEWDQTQFPSGTAIKDSKWASSVTVEGRTTRLFYVAPQGKTPLEVFRNYQQALVGAGFKTRFVCEQNCDGLYFAMQKTIEPSAGATYAGGSLADVGGGNYSLDGGLIEASQGRLWYGTLPRDGQDVHVLLYTSVAENDTTRLAATFLQIVEPKAMQTGQVTVDANALEKGLQTDGKIALYGLYFDTGKADIKPESQPQLAEMTKLMQAHPSLKVYIVGHTDNQGALDSNTTLSLQRAQAVVAALVKGGVDAKRLVARGVASLAPLASNASDAGRARNRRVELVEQ